MAAAAVRAFKHQQCKSPVIADGGLLGEVHRTRNDHLPCSGFGRAALGPQLSRLLDIQRLLGKFSANEKAVERFD
jgi:hypothetical protein